MKKIFKKGVHIVAQQVKSLTSIHEDVGSTPGLAHWVKDLALPQAALYVTDKDRIWHCCACGVAWQQQLQFIPWPRNFYVPQVWPFKEKEKEKKKKEKYHFGIFLIVKYVCLHLCHNCMYIIRSCTQ